MLCCWDRLGSICCRLLRGDIDELTTEVEACCCKFCDTPNVDAEIMLEVTGLRFTVIEPTEGAILRWSSGEPEPAEIGGIDFAEAREAGSRFENSRLAAECRCSLPAVKRQCPQMLVVILHSRQYLRWSPVNPI